MFIWKYLRRIVVSAFLNAMSGDNNIKNSGLINSPIDQRSSLYLPSVKMWNEQIRRNTFVKDHTAVPLPSVIRDHSVWKTETLFTPQNGSTNNSNELNPSQNEIVGEISEVNNGNNQSTPLKKAFEMANRTRDMLSKLDGWKALSIKPYPSPALPQNTPPVSGGYMIKSSSQFTTLDAKSDEAKNILQNIKDMAQILCPPEYGGVSHFRFMNDQNQNSGQYDNVPRSSCTSMQTIANHEDSTMGSSYIQNKAMDTKSPIVSAHRLGNQSQCISSSRINIIGRQGKPVVQYLSSYSANNSLGMGTSAPSAISATSMATESGQVQPQNVESYVGKDATQKPNLVKMKALYEDLMSKWNSNQQKGEATDSLYEDFDDGNFSSATAHSTEISLVNQAFDRNDSFDHFPEKNRSDYFTNSKDKNQEEWERDTQDFLRKLNSKSGVTKREFTNSSRQAYKSLPEGDEIEHYDDDEVYYGRPAANCSPFSFSRSETRHYGSSFNVNIKDLNRDRMNASRTERFERPDFRSQRSTNLVGSRGSSRETSKHKDANVKHPNQKLLFYDDGSHACKDCGLESMELPLYLDHLLSQEHVKKMMDLPKSWISPMFDESLLLKKTSEKVLAIRGTDAVYPVTEGFYCRPCKEYFPNKNEMMRHLASKNHDDECYFYNKSHKRPCDKNDSIPAKKLKMDAKIDKPLPKDNKMTTVVPSGGPTTIKGQPNKTQSTIKKEFNSKQILPKAKPSPILSKFTPQNSNAKPLAQGGPKHNVNNILSVGKMPVTAEAKCDDDVESDVDFVELDEWTEDN